ncbi:hypothetical protein D3C86_1847720 [compost metagenome]
MLFPDLMIDAEHPGVTGNFVGIPHDLVNTVYADVNSWFTAIVSGIQCANKVIML